MGEVVTDELDKIIRQALRPLELGDIFNLTEEEIEQKRVQAIQALIAKEVLRGKREEVLEIVSWGSKGQDRAIKRLAELNKQIGDSDDR